MAGIREVSCFKLHVPILLRLFERLDCPVRLLFHSKAEVEWYYFTCFCPLALYTSGLIY